MIPKKVNKSLFIELLAARLDQTPRRTEAILNHIITLIYGLLREGHTVNLSGFGKFSFSHRHSRLGVNPQEPQTKITIPELHTPKFRAGEVFKSIARSLDKKGGDDM